MEITQKDNQQILSNKVLIVDDEKLLREAFARILDKAEFITLTATTGREALEILDKEDISVIVSDISMPDMDGMELLKAVRERNLNLPVILITGNPTVETAARAVEYGALRYLLKPLDRDALIDAVSIAVKLHAIAQLKKEAAAYLNMTEDRTELEASLTRALDTLWMAYQPIVALPNKQIIAYEALVRTREPSIPHPGALFTVAEKLGRVYEVGRAIRTNVARTLKERRTNHDVFVNLHPNDLLDDTLFSPDSPIAPFAHNVVLEITERAALDSGADIPRRISRLRNLGFRIAIDDLGAGYAGLSYFAVLSPEVVKLDITLIRDVNREEIKQKLIGSLTSLCKDLNMIVVAEGIETTEERDTIMKLGCGYMQGFLFARPAPPFPEVLW